MDEPPEPAGAPVAGILERFGREEISAPVAVMQALIACGDVAATEEALRRAGADVLLGFLEGRRTGAETVAALLRAARGGGEGLARQRALFDGWVAQNAEASVAFYSFGDPGLLACATDELAAWLDRIGVLGAGRRALDVGCGIGRVALAIAPRLASVVGIDLSPAMIAEARRRAREVTHVRFEATAGRDLSQFSDESFDLVLAVDSLPLIHEADPRLLPRHVEEAARVLAAGGEFVALNLTYRGDLAADRADAARLAAACEFDLLSNGERPFRLWDGAAFRFRKPAS